MHSATSVILTLPFLASMVSAAAVTPRAPVPNIVGIGYGQQIQKNDEINHWVVWVEGKSACPNTRVLGHLVNSPCNQEFSYNGVTYHLGDCNGSNEPSNVYGGNAVRHCKKDHDKIHCHGSTHDIVKHGYCK